MARPTVYLKENMREERSCALFDYGTSLINKNATQNVLSSFSQRSTVIFKQSFLQEE